MVSDRIELWSDLRLENGKYVTDGQYGRQTQPRGLGLTINNWSLLASPLHGEECLMWSVERLSSASRCSSDLGALTRSNTPSPRSS